MDHLQYAYVEENFISYGLQEQPADAVVFIGGWPDGEPAKAKAEFFHERGYHVFLYQYKGLYRSHGTFLEESPAEGIQQVCQQVRAGELHNLYTNDTDEFSVKKLHVFGSSFGGCALAAAPRVQPDTLVLFAPVWDFSSLTADGGEDLDETMGFVERAFQHVYRYDFTDIEERLASFTDLRPEWYADKISSPLLVLHDPQDEVVPYAQTQRMQEKMNFEVIEHPLGHGSSDALEEYWDEIEAFLRVTTSKS